MSEQDYDAPGETRTDDSIGQEDSADAKALSRNGQKTAAKVSERELGEAAVSSPFAPK